MVIRIGKPIGKLFPLSPVMVKDILVLILELEMDLGTEMSIQISSISSKLISSIFFLALNQTNVLIPFVNTLTNLIRRR